MWQSHLEVEFELNKKLYLTSLPGQESDVSRTVATVKPVVLAEAREDRKELVITNDATSVLYVLLGEGVVTKDHYTFALAPKGVVAETATLDKWCGKVSGRWDARGGFAMVTETA